jgi:RNA polymerase sigma-70 factor (ECF subfamily)
LDEAQVISQVRTGATEAFREIVEHYQAPIVRYLSRLTGDTEVARDLAQDTFVQAYKRILKTRSELHLKAWLYRIATNNALQYHRRRRLLSFVPFVGSEGSAIVDTSTSPDAVPERMAIQEALLESPLQRRECLVLHYVEGLKYKEFRAAYRRLSGDVPE